MPFKFSATFVLSIHNKQALAIIVRFRKRGWNGIPEYSNLACNAKAKLDINPCNYGVGNLGFTFENNNIESRRGDLSPEGAGNAKQWLVFSYKDDFLKATYCVCLVLGNTENGMRYVWPTFDL